MIGPYGNLVCPSNLIGRSDLLVLKRAIWLDALTCWSWKSNLIGRFDLLVLKDRYDWTLWIVGLERAILLDDPEICLRAPSMDFLFRNFRQWFANNKKTIRKMRLVLRRIRRSNCHSAQNKQLTVSFYITYSTRGGVLTVHYAQRWSSVSDDVVYV